MKEENRRKQKKSHSWDCERLEALRQHRNIVEFIQSEEVKKGEMKKNEHWTDNRNDCKKSWDNQEYFEIGIAFAFGSFSLGLRRWINSLGSNQIVNRLRIFTVDAKTVATADEVATATNTKRCE